MTWFYLNLDTLKKDSADGFYHFNKKVTFW